MSLPAFDGDAFRVECDSCISVRGGGTTSYDARECGVPVGWFATLSRDAYFFSCSPKCRESIRAELVRQGRPSVPVE